MGLWSAANVNSIAILEHGPVRLKACRYGPLLYMENEWEEKSEPLIRQLMTWNYRLYWHFPLLFNPANHFQNPTDVFHQVVSTNMLCVPANVQQNLAGFKEITDPQESAAGMLRANRERQAAEGK